MRIQKNIWGNFGHWLIFILILPPFFLAFSQEGFTRYYTIPGSQYSNTNHVIERPDSGFIIAGATDVSIGNEVITRLTLLGTNNHGALQWSKSFGTKMLDFPFNLFQPSLIFCQDSSGFFISGPARDSTGRTFGMLAKFNYDGDTLWLKKFDDSSGRLLPMCLTRAERGGFYMAGTFEPQTGGQPIFVCRLDGVGNELWRKIINKASPNVFDAKDIVCDSATGKLLIVGFQYIGSGSFNSILFADSLGVKIKQIYYNNSCGGPAGRVIQSHDKNFIVGNKVGVNCANAIYRSGLIKFDIEGTVIWNYEHPLPGPFNSIAPVGERPNGDIIAVGYVDTSWSVELQYLIFDKNGKLKRTTKYGRKREYYFDLIRGGTHTSDDGYALAIQLNQEPAPSSFCLIKLDSLGCDTTPEYCAAQVVGLNEQSQALSAELFPNPCNTSLNIKLPVTGGEVNYVITAQSGVVLRRGSFKGAEASINTSELAEGLYVIELSTSEGVLRRKFAVMR